MSSAAKKKKTSKKPKETRGRVKRGAKRPAAGKPKSKVKPRAANADSSARLGRWVLIVGCFCLLWPLGRLAFAIAAERIAESISGLDASVAAVALGEGGRRVHVEGLRLRHPQRFGEFLRVDHVEVPFARPLWRDRGGSIGEVKLRGLCLRIYPGDLEGLSSDRAPKPSTPSPREKRPSPPTEKRSESPRGPSSILVEDSRVELAMLRAGQAPFILTLRIASLRALPDEEGGWQLDRVDAHFLGGRLGIEGGLTARRDWKVDARLAGADLAKHPEAAAFGADGSLNAALKLRSTPRGPEGAGWLDLRRGLLWELPVFSDLVAALGLATGGFIWKMAAWSSANSTCAGLRSPCGAAAASLSMEARSISISCRASPRV
jgi:hypothetical protein